jgi:vancomycin permeability regulator SanA
VIPAAEILDVSDNKADIKAVGQLYKAGKMQKLLLAGSNSDTLDALQAEAIKAGVPAQNIKQDTASKRVYDMCYRLENVYSTNEVMVISNNLDLPRILFICNSLKVSAKGFYLDEDHASASITDQLKHLLALAQSVWEVNGAAPADLVKSEKLSL